MRELAVSYLIAYLSVLGIALGAMAVLMLHNLTGGGWGTAIRRPLAAAVATLPWLALFFIPVALAMPLLYPWTREDISHWYLNSTFFLVRAIVYFIVWLLLAHWLLRWEAARSPRLARLSAAGLIVHGLTVSFAAFDWIMSLTPHWRSTTFGLLVGTGQMLAALAFATAVVCWLRSTTAERLHDLGNLLLTFVMMWAYLAFTQYLIIWIGNLPREISWYVPRTETSWRWLAVFLIVFYFALPLCALLSRQAKRSTLALGVIASLVLAVHVIDVFWLVAPSFYPDGFALHASDLLLPLLIGAWLAFCARRLNVVTTSDRDPSNARA